MVGLGVASEERENIVISGEIFREYDIRGVVEEDLTPPVMEVLGEALGEYFSMSREGKPGREGDSGKKVLVGRDNRASSPALHKALIAGLAAAGYGVMDLGMVITPIFYYAPYLYELQQGAMITASHNPPEYNGLKVLDGQGTIYGEEIKRIGEIATRLAREGRSGTRKTAGPSVRSAENSPAVEGVDPVPAYLEMLTEKLQLGPRRLRVVVDCGNGTASLFAPELFRRLGCEVIELYCDSDPTFPHHHPDPTVLENMADLRRVVVEKKADIGLAFDGDGDRLGVVDEQGNVLWGDQIMILFWREILPKYPGTIGIVEVKCSQALYEEIERLGGKPMFYRTGHSLIKAKMRETGAVFTGEMSGHMFFADEYFGYDDALYAAGRLLRILSHTQESLSALLADVPRYYSTPETRISCPEEEKFSVVAALTEGFRRRFPVIDVDGVRVLFPQGWGLVRASNTSPMLVARCEGKTPQALEEIKREMKAALAQFPAVGEVAF